MSLIKKAFRIACEAHKNQVDKSGEPYIYHPVRVALNVNGEFEKAVALLHDVLEDTQVVEDDLRFLFHEKIVDAVVLLTKINNENNETYYKKLLTNEIAKKVKIADLLDNLSPDRLKKLDKNTKNRLILKYNKGLKILTKIGG